MTDEGKYNEDNQKKVGLGRARKHFYITTSSVVRLPEDNEMLQNYAMRSILKADRKTCTQTMRDELNLLTLSNRRRFLRFQLI